MTCPDAGRWRAWLDDEAGAQAAQLRSHLAACTVCPGTVERLQQDAAVVSTALGSLGPAAMPSARATSLARERLARSELDLVSRRAAARPVHPISERTPVTSASTFQRWRLGFGALAAALALTFFIGTPQGQAAAAQFLAQFRSQRFAPITIDPQSRGALAALEYLGTVSGSGPDARRADEVGSVAEASQRVGFAVRQPAPEALPSSVARTPRIKIAPASEVRFRFDNAKARAYYDRIGRPDVSLPDRFDGATLALSIPASAVLEYSGADRGAGLVIGQGRELTAGVEGNVSLNELREFLLGLPGLPPEAVRQLREIRDWQNVLPIPIPPSVAWRDTRVGSTPALVLSDNSGLPSALIWQRDGRIYGVAGSFSSAEIERVANALQ